MIGKTLGHYQITSQLGKGGMGEVYRAKDQVLGRDVAIKVLPEEFARNSDRVVRFQREAKLLASLNHPNIAAIHGLEESGGTNFLVLELIEGDTLADRIKGSPIPVEESLKLALQIAEALEAAHEKGVIHRDLKPTNIKITPEGKVKVLDFGLAKAFAGEQAEVNLSHSPTLSEAATQQGIILGTAAYMSPEQARGNPVDKRADIWAFGVVLFEMLTGRQVFSENTVSDTLASVLKSEPEWKQLPPNLHPRIRFLLERCLEKEAKNRCHEFADVRVEIQKVLADPSGALVQPFTGVKPKKKLRLGLPRVAAAVVLASLIVGVSVWKLRPTEPRQVIRSEYYLPEDQKLGNVIYPNLAISPDGKQFVYATAKGLYLRSIEEFDAKLIIGTETSPSNPFFSPDGKWIGYFSTSDSKLKKIGINGGAPVALCDANLLVGASWGADDRIVFAEYARDIKSVSSNGGIPDVIAKGAAFYHPQLLPDGKSLLLTVGVYPYKIIVQSLRSDEHTELFAGDNARYIPTGHIIYALGNNLFAVPFDLKTLKATGGQVPMVEGVWRITPERTPQYAVSDSGTLVYIQGKTGEAAPDQRTLVWVDRRGKEQPLPIQAGDYATPKISPDGKKIALTVQTGAKSDIWIWDIIRDTMTRLTFNESSAYALWNQQGSRIAFTNQKSTTGSFGGDIYWKAADGTGNDEKLGSGSGRMVLPWSWSKDGKTLALFEAELSGGINYDIGMLSMEGSHERKPLLNQKYVETQPKISPDGKWMAYTSDESGKAQIYVRPFPDANSGRWQVSAAGGNTPLWSPDGHELFYFNGDTAMRVSVETDPTFRAGKPELLFRGSYVQLSTSDGQPWDIHPNGKKFLMMKPPASTSATSAASGPRKINIVINWFEELKQKVLVK